MPPPHPPTPHHHPHLDSNKWLPRSLPSQGAVMIVIQIRGNISFFSYFCAFGWKHAALQKAGQCNWTMSQAFKCVDSVFSSLLQDCRSIVHIVAPQLPKPEEFPNESNDSEKYMQQNQIFNLKYTVCKFRRNTFQEYCCTMEPKQRNSPTRAMTQLFSC